MGDLLGWDTARTTPELAAYQQHVREVKTFPAPTRRRLHDHRRGSWLTPAPRTATRSWRDSAADAVRCAHDETLTTHSHDYWCFACCG